MTTYYNKVLEAVDPAVYAVNPAAYLGLQARFGQWSVNLPDPWLSEWVHYNVVTSQNSMRVNRREPQWADGTATPNPGLVPLNWFSWSYTVTWGQFKSLEQNPNGLVAQTIKQGLRSQQDYFQKNVDKWLMGTLTLTGSEAQADDWPKLMYKSSTGTIADPSDSNAVAGTQTDLSAVALSGTAQDVESVRKTFGAIVAQFYQKYDSNTEQAMYTGNDTFTHFGHPAAFKVLEGVHESNASGEVMDALSLDLIRQTGEIVPTMAVDAGYTGATTVEADFITAMNMKENFKVITAVPYTVTDWELYQGKPGQSKVFRKMGYTKLGVMAVPYSLGGSYYKACQHWKTEPYTNS